jgi:hypothetical protein
MDLILNKKYTCINCSTNFYLINLNQPFCPKCNFEIGSTMTNSKKIKKSSSKPSSTKDKIAKEDLITITKEIKDLLFSDDLLFEKYQYMGFEFEDKKLVRDYKANNRSGNNTIEGRSLKVKNLKTNKSYEIGFSPVDYWSIDGTLIFVTINNKDSAVIQYNLSLNLEPLSNSDYLCTHNGSVTIVKRLEGKYIVQFVKNKDSSMVIGSQINLDKIHLTSEKYSFENYKYFFSRLIIYSIYLDEFKDSIRELIKSERIPIPENLKWEILKRDNYQCKKCGSTESLQIDHVRPYSWYVKENQEQKANDEENLQVLCQKCNLEKSNKHATRY